MIPSEPGVLYLIRGLPGSGRSTLARELAGATGVVICPETEIGVAPRAAVFGRKFNALCLNKAMMSLEQAFRARATPIVLDRPHVHIWEMNQPIAAADKAGYRVEIRRTRTPWADNAMECHRRTHQNVDRAKLREMVRCFEPDVAPEFVRHIPKPTQRMARARMLVRSLPALPPAERKLAEAELFEHYDLEYMALLAEGFVQQFAPCFKEAMKHPRALDLDAPERE